MDHLIHLYLVRFIVISGVLGYGVWVIKTVKGEILKG